MHCVCPTEMVHLTFLNTDIKFTPVNLKTWRSIITSGLWVILLFFHSSNVFIERQHRFISFSSFSDNRMYEGCVLISSTWSLILQENNQRFDRHLPWNCFTCCKVCVFNWNEIKLNDWTRYLSHIYHFINHFILLTIVHLVLAEGEKNHF